MLVGLRIVACLRFALRFAQRAMVGVTLYDWRNAPQQATQVGRNAGASEPAKYPGVGQGCC